MLYDIVTNRNIRICMESHNYKKENKTRSEILTRFSSFCK